MILHHTSKTILYPNAPFIMCEYAHAEGNSLGNFKIYWDLIRAIKRIYREDLFGIW